MASISKEEYDIFSSVYNSLKSDILLNKNINPFSGAFFKILKLYIEPLFYDIDYKKIKYLVIRELMLEINGNTDFCFLTGYKEGEITTVVAGYNDSKVNFFAHKNWTDALDIGCAPFIVLMAFINTNGKINLKNIIEIFDDILPLSINKNNIYIFRDDRENTNFLENILEKFIWNRFKVLIEESIFEFSDFVIIELLKHKMIPYNFILGCTTSKNSNSFIFNKFPYIHGNKIKPTRVYLDPLFMFVDLSSHLVNTLIFDYGNKEEFELIVDCYLNSIDRYGKILNDGYKSQEYRNIFGGKNDYIVLDLVPPFLPSNNFDRIKISFISFILKLYNNKKANKFYNIGEKNKFNSKLKNTLNNFENNVIFNAIEKVQEELENDIDSFKIEDINIFNFNNSKKHLLNFVNIPPYLNRINYNSFIDEIKANNSLISFETLLQIFQFKISSNFYNFKEIIKIKEDENFSGEDLYTINYYPENVSGGLKGTFIDNDKNKIEIYFKKYFVFSNDLNTSLNTEILSNSNSNLYLLSLIYMKYKETYDFEFLKDLILTQIYTSYLDNGNNYNSNDLKYINTVINEIEIFNFNNNTDLTFGMANSFIDSPINISNAMNTKNYRLKDLQILLEIFTVIQEKIDYIFEEFILTEKENLEKYKETTLKEINIGTLFFDHDITDIDDAVFWFGLNKMCKQTSNNKYSNQKFIIKLNPTFKDQFAKRVENLIHLINSIISYYGH